MVIPCIDLMGRKLAIGKGKAVRELVAEIFPTAAALKSADARPGPIWSCPSQSAWTR